MQYTLKVIFANSVDPDQTAPLGAVWSGSTLLAYMQKVCLKSLQEDAAADINRRHFFLEGFLGALRVNWYLDKLHWPYCLPLTQHFLDTK